MVELNDQQFKKEFRFAKPDIARLLNCLQWPRFFELPNKMVFTSELCLLMVLYQFHFPSTLTQLSRDSIWCSIQQLLVHRNGSTKTLTMLILCISIVEEMPPHKVAPLSS